MTSVAVGRAIRATRERANLPLARVARKCNLSTTQLHGIESGRERPSVAVLDRIARALGMSLVELVVNPRAASTAVRAGPRRLGISDIAQAILDLPESIGSKMDIVQHATVLVAMSACQENQSAAARMLGMERKAFARKLSRARRPAKESTSNGSFRSAVRARPAQPDASLRSAVRAKRDLAASTRRAG